MRATPWPFRRPAGERDFVPSPPQGQQALVAALDAVAASISSADTVHQMLAVIVDSAKQFTGTEKVVICLIDEYAKGLALDEDTLVVRGARSKHEQQWWGDHLAAVADGVLSSGERQFEIDAEQGAWLLTVPVSVQDQPLGVLAVINSVNHRLLPEHTAFLSILGALAAISIANARLAENARHAMLAGERERIAREMHDGIAQSLFSVSLGMELAKKQAVSNPTQVVATLEDLQVQLNTSAAELRRLIYDLRPLKLAEIGLVDSLQAWMHEATRGTDVRGVTEVLGTSYRLRAAEEACLYSVAREAISNAVRHSGGRHVRARLEFGEQMVMLTVADDGHGIPTPTATLQLEGTGAGLRNMRERMSAAGGRLSIEGTSGEGTVVRAELPVEDR